MEQWLDAPEVMAGKNKNDVTQFLGKLISNWYWILAGAIMGLAVAVLYLRYKTPVYRIRAKILVNDEKKGSGIMGQNSLIDLGSLLNTKNSVDNEAEVLKTRYLMERTVSATNANIIYYKKGTVKDRELFHPPFRVMMLEANDTIHPKSFDLLFEGKDSILISGDAFHRKVPFDHPFRLEGTGLVTIRRSPGQAVLFDDYGFRITSVDDQVADYMRRLFVEVTNKQVSTIDLTFDSPIPEKGEFILGALIDEYVKGNRNDRTAIADSTISFIDGRLLFVGRELGDVEGNIQQFKQKNQLADLSEQSKLLLENSGGYVKQLAEVETQINMINSLSDLLADSKSNRVLPSAVLPQDFVFNGLIERFNMLLLERDQQLLSVTEDNPAMLNLNSQIANLRKDIQANLASTAHNLSIVRENLLGKTRQMEGEIRKVPATERIYLDLARQQEIKQELFVFLLQKREETAISKISNIANSKLIDPPKSDNHPFTPRRMYILLMGLMAGTAVMMGIIYLREVLNTRVMHRTDITRHTHVPVIAEIGNSADQQHVVVINGGNRSIVAEQLRTLRTNLSFFLKEGQQTVLLTSGMSGEGKSFIALNLAAVLAISGKKVLVMEMDLRKPKVTAKLGRENKLGITNYIITPDMKPEDIIRPSGLLDNMYLASSGPVPPNPAEIILHERLAGLMEAVKEQFDYIIIDAPPVGLVTDAQLLNKYADLTLFLVRQRYTYKHQLAIAEDLYRHKKMKNIAILVNDVKQGNGYYGYGNGYYRNGYNYYEQEEASNTGGFLQYFNRKK